MTPRQRIAELYWRYPQPRTFDTDEHLHRVTGYVIEGDDFFLMGRGVDRFEKEEAILSPHVIFPRSRQNTWMIWAFAGPLEKMFGAAPYPLEWVCWIRRNRHLRFYRCEHALRKLGDVRFIAYIQNCESQSDLSS